MKYSVGLIAILTALLHAPLSQAAPVGQLGKSCHLPGAEEALRCIEVPAPFDSAQPGGASLKLQVTVAPAFREAAKADPLFVLAGGPGQAGSDLLPLLNTAFRKVRATRDIVFIDQRGTGLSGKLDCDSKPGQDHLSDAQIEAETRACLSGLKQPLALFTTAAAVQDLEQVRRALGYARVNLWGGSYGTRLGQAYARAYPASVRSLILDGVAAPDQIIPAGGHDAQAALDKLFALCAADPACARTYPGLPAEFAALAQRVDGGTVRLELPDPRTAAPLKVDMSSRRFLSTVHSILYSPIDSRRLPFLIHSAYLGRWEPFLARSNLAGDFSADGMIAYGLHLAVICAEDVPRLTPALIAEDTRGSFVTAALIARSASLCEAVHVPPVPYTAPARIDAPVLLFSGTLDPVTPPRRAEAAMRAMAHAQHFIVANAGHGVSMLGCAPRLMREFLDHPEQPLAAGCLREIPAPSFQLGSAGPQP